MSLPLELKMQICNYVYQIPHYFISQTKITKAFQKEHGYL